MALDAWKLRLVEVVMYLVFLVSALALYFRRTVAGIHHVSESEMTTRPIGGAQEGIDS